MCSNLRPIRDGFSFRTTPARCRCTSPLDCDRDGQVQASFSPGNVHPCGRSLRRSFWFGPPPGLESGPARFTIYHRLHGTTSAVESDSALARLKFDTLGSCGRSFSIPRPGMRYADFRRRRGLAWDEASSGCKMGEQIHMPNSRPMPVVAAGVSELRVQDDDGIYRVFYYTTSTQGVLVFHAFVKKTQRTPPLEIELARKRLKELLDA